MSKRYLAVLACLFALVAATTAQAHEFLVMPVKYIVQKGETVPFSVVSAHVMMVSEEAEPLKHVKLALLEGKKSTPLSVVQNDMLLTLDGQFVPAAEGTAVINGHREGVIWNNTTKGWVEGSKKDLSGVISSNLYEKFCKTLITVGKGDDSWSRVLGQKLEIVPLSDPTQAKPGDEIGFKFLYEGKPVAPENVLATYNGFSYETMAFAYSAEPTEDGSAKVKITAPGVWMVRIQHKVDAKTADYDGHVMRSVLIFEVR
ncbi:MAG: DUF4198 domain-containing protein [Desulfovibrionaceae bacterium]